MYIVFLGPPGSGKGTYSNITSKWLGIPVIATGDMLRDSIEKGTPLGEKVRKFLESGELVPDDIMEKVISDALDSEAADNGIIFDGFPRTVAQAEILQRLLENRGNKLDLVIELYSDDDEIIRRLSNRRVCPKCNAIYNLITSPPRDDNKCDICGTQLIQREDDKPETIRHRLSVYRKQTAPLLEFYRNQKDLKYFIIDTNGTPELARNAIRKKLLENGII